MNISTSRQDGKIELYGIQVLRGVAALMVVMHHTLEESLAGTAGPKIPEWSIVFGAAGVDLFFVISGFIMFYVSFNGGTAPGPKNFIFRRLLRIFPLYWLCVILILMLHHSLGLFSSGDYSAKALFLAATLLPGHSAVYVAWTLTYELYFYLIFAVTLFARSPRTTLIGTISLIVCLMAASLALPASTATRFISNPISLEFCFGLMMAFLYSRGNRPGRPLIFIVAGLAAMLLSSLLIDHPNTGGLSPWSRTIAWGIPAAFVVAGSISVKIPNNLLGRASILLGDASYSIYLSHIFVMIAYARLLKTTRLGELYQGGIIPIVIVISTLAGLAVHLFAERQIMALLKFRSSRTAAAPV
jgi:exopolysaccharide production protein ExoZ